MIRVTDSTGIPHRMDSPDTVKECLTGETLTFTGIGADTVLDGATFTAETTGLHRLRVTLTSGVRQVLVRVVDPSVLAAIPDPGFRVGHGQSTAPRLALRAICNHGPLSWDGTAAWFFDGRIKLADYGIVTPHN